MRLELLTRGRGAVLVESRGPVPAGLDREWRPTAQIAAAAGLDRRRARKLLELLLQRGWVQSTYDGAGVRLWRLEPRTADRIARAAK